MNTNLTNTIIHHILLNIGLNKNDNTIFNDSFLLNEHIEYVDEFDNTNLAPIYSCQMKANTSQFQIICTKLFTDYDKSLDEDVYLLVKLEGCPIYGCYLSLLTDKMDHENNQLYSEGFISCFIDNKTWVPAPIFIQATFLAGMEQLKELSAPFTKINDAQELFNNLKSFIMYRQNYMGKDDEG